MEWQEVERPGYFGKKRDEICTSWDEKYGKNNWEIIWDWNPKLKRQDALQIYEDSYYEFLKKNNGILEWLIDYENVFDTAPSNVHAKFDYKVQETPNNHLHDIAIRRSVMRLGKWFKGKKGILHVRSNDSEGFVLSPCKVPFHIPEMIYRGDIKDYPGKGKWWLRIGIKDSVEEFYQQNKILIAKA